MATGWERGADGLWRYELPDGKLKPDVTLERFDLGDATYYGTYLEDIYDMPDLYRAYPELRYTRVLFTELTEQLGFAVEDNWIVINDDSINKMKDGVIIINTARGTLIDSNALIKGIKSQKIGAVGLDVIEDETGLYYYNHSSDVLNNDELAILNSFPNVIVTPHTAFYTETTVRNMLEKTFKSLVHFSKNDDNPYEIKL